MSMTQSQLRTNEAELIKSVCAGEREAFYELVRPYERMIYATAIFSCEKSGGCRGGGAEGRSKGLLPHFCLPRGSKVQHLAGSNHIQRGQDEVEEGPSAPL